MSDPELSSSRAPQLGPPRPKCKLPARYITSILDVKRDRAVMVYRCAPCGEEIWKD